MPNVLDDIVSSLRDVRTPTVSKVEDVVENIVYVQLHTSNKYSTMLDKGVVYKATHKEDSRLICLDDSYYALSEFDIVDSSMYKEHKTIYIKSSDYTNILYNIINRNRLYLAAKSFNTTRDSRIEIDSKGVLTHRGNIIKLGKLLRAIYPIHTDEELESMVNEWKSTFNIDTNNVQLTTNVAEVYDIGSVGGSCMANKGEFMELYEELGVEIAYISTNDCVLHARALVWSELLDRDSKEKIEGKYIDRVFFDKKIDELTLLQWARENNIGLLKDLVEDKRVRTSKAFSYQYNGVPYIDTMQYVVRKKNSDMYYLTGDSKNTYDCCTSTNGGTDNGNITDYYDENSVYCEDTGNYVDSGYYYVEDLGVYYEYSDELIYIDSYGYYLSDNEGICYCEDIEEYSFKDDCYYAEDEGFWYNTSDSLYFTYDTDVYYASNEDLIYCDDISEWVTDGSTTYFVQDLDYTYYDDIDLYYGGGLWWSSEEAYKEENPEED